MKKVGIVILILFVAGLGTYFYLNQSMPAGKQGSEADAMANKMRDAIGMEAWEKIPYVTFSFADSHHYIWDKKNDRASIKWDDYEVKMNLSNQNGVALKANEKLEGDDAKDAIAKAWSYWCNDSFWFNAPAKVMDGGTTLSVVDLDEGGKGLKVTYGSGGVTPGDTYVWALDDNGLPKYFKMWVSIIPVGGVKATWESWETFDGAKISTLHEIGPKSLKINDVSSGNTLSDMGLSSDYFNGI